MTRLAARLAALAWICAASSVLAQSSVTPRTTPAAPTTVKAKSPPPKPPDDLRAKTPPPKPPDDKRSTPPPPLPPSNIPLPDPNRDPTTPGRNPAASGTIVQRPPEPDPTDPARADTDEADDATTPGSAPPPIAPTPGVTATPPPPAPSDDATEDDVARELARELLIVAQDLDEAEAQRQWFAQQGMGVLRRRTLGGLRWVLTVYRIPPETDVPSLVEAVVATWPSAFAEVNQRYLPLAEVAQGKQVVYAAALISLPQQGCASPVRIAMLDGPVNVALSAFPANRIQTTDIADRTEHPRYDHASGIAALWLADGEARGLVPNAELFAANIFGESKKGSFTTTEWVVRGLDWVLGLPQVPAVVNLSFGGPRSPLLARAIERTQESTRVVAAGGNDGTDEVVYPAALPGVIGVTAVDARRKRWTLANTGDHIAIAAPGVDIWTIDGTGRGYYASGTSFASAFVTAALAISTPRQDELGAWLENYTVDLGTAGRDPQFGFGLLHASGLCK